MGGRPNARTRAAHSYLDHVHTRSGQSIPLGPYLCARSEPDLRSGRGGADRARRRPRISAVRVRYGGSPPAVSAAPAPGSPGPPYKDVLAPSPLVDAPF